MTDVSHDEWKGTTGGMPWMQRSLIKILGVTDVRVLYAVLTLVVPFYMLIGHRGYVAQYRFFRDAFGENPLKSFWHVYVNHFRFGQIIIDRFAVYGGRHFRFLFDNLSEWQRLEAGESGFVLVSSHTGNYELAGYSLRTDRKPLNALVFLGETATVMQNRQRVFAPNNIRMVPVTSDMAHIFTLSNALRDGEIVSMPGDRIFGSQKSVECEFFGKTARFPIGPFSLAVQRETPICAITVMKEGCYEYRVRLIPLQLSEEERELKKREQMELLGRRFAEALEQQVRRYPTQWFNYYDFWKE